MACSVCLLYLVHVSKQLQLCFYSSSPASRLPYSALLYVDGLSGIAVYISRSAYYQPHIAWAFWAPLDLGRRRRCCPLFSGLAFTLHPCSDPFRPRAAKQPTKRPNLPSIYRRATIICPDSFDSVVLLRAADIGKPSPRTRRHRFSTLDSTKICVASAQARQYSSRQILASCSHDGQGHGRDFG
jgi:hypothetical protein